jgi:hypothetical protein
MTRRFFLRLLAGLPVFSPLVGPFWGASPFASQGPEAISREPIGQAFSGEALHYEITFPLFGRVAEVTMSFAPAEENGRYVSMLQGETVGFFGLSTRYRKDSYRSVMEELDHGARLRSLVFEERVEIGNKSRRRTHIFDHNSRKWVERKIRKSGATSEQTRDIPHDRDYNDFLTAAYNFRYGVYGIPEKGRTYNVPVFPRKRANTYDVRILSSEEEDRLRRRESPRAGSAYRVELAMDPEVLHSKRGRIDGWLSRELCPVEGVIKDVLLFGDVRGTLLRKEMKGAGQEIHFSSPPRA